MGAVFIAKKNMWSTLLCFARFLLRTETWRTPLGLDVQGRTCAVIPTYSTSKEERQHGIEHVVEVEMFKAFVDEFQG